jgi:glycosyltransferase involved in cell wall biosynthesis
MIRVLIVGTFGGGGIHHYAEAQRDHLADDLEVSTYDMFTAVGGEGVVWFLSSLVRSLWAALRFPFRRPPDVVHVHTSHRFSFYRASFYVLFAAHVWRRPVVLHVHGSSFDDFLEDRSWWQARLQSLVFDATDHVIVLSEYWRDVLSDHVGGATVSAVPNAVDPGEYDPAFGGDPHVVFVSNLIERKGVTELVAALDRLQTDREFRASIAGRGPLAPAVEDLADRHENVEYPGYVSEAEKRALLDSGTMFVLPAYAEGLPIAMLEGMAGGNAVVATDVGSIPEVITDENGILVEPGDAEGLTGALETLLADPERAERMGRTNRRLVRERYSWEAATERLCRIYERETRTGPAVNSD